MQSALEINNYIQPLRGKFIDSFKAVQMFPELAPIFAKSEELAQRPRRTNDAFFFIFENGQFSFETQDYDVASDFLMDTPGSQGFQVSYLTGLSVCADQER